jgi:hypothetical protein
VVIVTRNGMLCPCIGTKREASAGLVSHH